MESEFPKRPAHREWRRRAKKERRKRLRQKAARERDEEADRLKKTLLQSSDYLQWLDEQNRLQVQEEKRAEEEHAQLEKAWLEAEEKAQKDWLVLQERKAKAREIQLAQEEIIRKEFETMQDNARKKKEAERRRRDEQKKMFERMKKEIDAYIDDGSRTPKALRSLNETQPGKEICPFFNKTGACRYGDICSRNHQRPGLSTVILVPNFYTHFSLERHSHEYDTDVRLEYDHRETRNHFRDFYFDVVPELEKFGKIKTLQYCKNTEAHLRGNLYVEYTTEREAARALRGLKGRWYAGRQLHCEFVNLKSWRGAICGMMRCPKGSACNFLHVFRNPTEDYGVKSPPLWQKRQEMFERTGSSSRSRGSFNNRRSNWEEYDNGQERNRNWRWSESPEQDDRRQGGGRPHQYRPQMQRNFHQRNQFNNRNNNFDNRRNNFYNNRRPRNFNDNRNRYSDDDRDDNRFNKPQRRQFNYNDKFKRRYSDSDGNEDYGTSKFRRRERRSLDKRSRSRSRSRSASRSPSRSRSRGSRSRSRSHSRSRSRSESGSKSRSRSISKSASRSRTRSRSPIHGTAMEEHDFHSKRMRAREAGRVARSVSRERKRRPPSPLSAPKEKSQPKVVRKTPTQNVSKWDNEKREDSSTESRDSRSRSGSRSRSRSRSASPYKTNEHKNNVNIQQQAQHRDIQHHSYSKPPPPQPSSAGNANRSGGQKEYEWDTTDSEN